MRILPASLASFRPFSDSGQSYHPVKRFSSFHVLSPWRTSTTWYFFSPAIISDVRLPARPAVAAVAAARRRPTAECWRKAVVVGVALSSPSVVATRPRSIWMDWHRLLGDGLAGTAGWCLPRLALSVCIVLSYPASHGLESWREGRRAAGTGGARCWKRRGGGVPFLGVASFLSGGGVRVRMGVRKEIREGRRARMIAANDTK